MDDDMIISESLIRANPTTKPLIERRVAGAAWLIKEPVTMILGPYDGHNEAYFDPKLFDLLKLPHGDNVSHDEHERSMDKAFDWLFRGVDNGTVVDGFLDTNGNFLTRQEAAKAVKLQDKKNPERDWLDSEDILFHGYGDIKEDYQWTDPQDRLDGLAGTMVSRAAFDHHGYTYVVEFYEIPREVSSLIDLPDHSFQVGFRREDEDDYEGRVRYGDTPQPRKLVRNVTEIIGDWIIENHPNVLLAGAPDDQKFRIFSMVAKSLQGLATQHGYAISTVEIEALGANTIVIAKFNEDEDMIAEDDDDHGHALAQTGYWGRAGAGCIIMAADTHRVLIPKRSQWVEQPGTWGTWGGAIDRGEDPQQAAMREVQEEAGYQGQIDQMIHLYRFEDNAFRYDTYLAVVDYEFEPSLNWESEDAQWFEIGQWPRPLHFGLEAVLTDPVAKNKLGMASS